ncbi:MAG: carbamoyl phosphate synthase small subunit [Clostridia bacterium]|nr:carbamoyl phosphate synthase small subunit [Clostridia bacterium]
MKKYLVLENGMTFAGEAFGADADADILAEIVFSTAMVGYAETLTDPRYAGQAVCQTFPLIGNYGVNPADCESGTVTPAAYIVRELCDAPSNFRCEETLGEFLRKYGIPGICGIDTRLLTKTLRDNGTMNGVITADPSSVNLEEVRAYRVTGAVERVSAKDIRLETPDNACCTVALLDLGVTNSVLAELNRLGCRVYVLPHTTTAAEIKALSPDGLFVSGGPGNPADCAGVTETLKALLPDKIPTMAVGLGHQLLAMANGMNITKLPCGHRGSNHPVRETSSGHLFITAQNHGYAVTDLCPDIAEETFVNVNDGSNEGLCYKHTPAFSVQFIPDTHEISANTEYLYRNFMEMIKK